MEDKSRDSNHRRYPGKNRTILIVALLAVVLASGTALGLVKASENPSFCTACHIMEPYYQSWDNSCLLAHVHAEEGLTCHECHDESLGAKAQEGFKYVTGDYEEPLPQLDFSREDCLECHTDFEEVMVSTDHGGGENPHDSPHWEDMECTMCHSMHGQSQVYCTQCHDFEWAEYLGENWNY